MTDSSSKTGHERLDRDSKKESLRDFPVSEEGYFSDNENYDDVHDENYSVEIDGKSVFCKSISLGDFVSSKVKGLKMQVTTALIRATLWKDMDGGVPYALESAVSAFNGNKGVTYYEFTGKYGESDDLDFKSYDGPDGELLELYLELWNKYLVLLNYALDGLQGKNRSLTPPDTVSRLEQLTAYARMHGDSGLGEAAAALFPEWSEDFVKSLVKQEVAIGNLAETASSLPTQAPEIYGGLRGPETPPEFVKRVYAPWLGQGLDRAHIKHLDPKLYTAIDNWTRKPGNEWPADVDLPTRGAQTRRTIEQLKQEAPDGRIGKVLGDFTAREAQRIRAAVRRQEQKR